MPRTHRPAALLLSLGLALAGLTACAEEEPEPKFTDEPTAAATPVEKKETAKEFIRRWARVQTEMQQKGDSTEYRRIAGKCEPCMVSADLIDEIYAAGGSVTTAGMTVRSVTLEASTRRAQTHRVEVDIAPTEYRESATSEVQMMPGGRSTYSAVIAPSKADGWQFINFMKVPE